MVGRGFEGNAPNAEEASESVSRCGPMLVSMCRDRPLLVAARVLVLFLQASPAPGRNHIRAHADILKKQLQQDKDGSSRSDTQLLLCTC